MVWLYHRHKIDEDWTINVLRLFSESDWTSSGVKESPIWECVEVDKYICPIFYNKINFVNNALYNLLDYGNEYVENVVIIEQVTRNSLSAIDASINEKTILRQDFDISEDGKN